jgi:hypothetical protein
MGNGESAERGLRGVAFSDTAVTRSIEFPAHRHRATRLLGLNGTALVLQTRFWVTPEQLRRRTFEFARRVMVFSRPLLERREARDVALQLRRAAMSVASNYRAHYP